MGWLGKRKPEGWYPVEAASGPGCRPAVLYFHPEMPAAAVAVTVGAVTDEDGAPRVQVTAEWQIRIAADAEWHFTRSELLPADHESPEESAADADVIVKWLLRGASPAELMTDLAPGFAALIRDWDGQPFDDAEAA